MKWPILGMLVVALVSCTPVSSPTPTEELGAGEFRSRATAECRFVFETVAQLKLRFLLTQSELIDWAADTMETQSDEALAELYERGEAVVMGAKPGLEEYLQGLKAMTPPPGVQDWYELEVQAYELRLAAYEDILASYRQDSQELWDSGWEKFGAAQEMGLKAAAEQVRLMQECQVGQ